ncbi:hypothetical protein FGB62_50g230 [Gracilaria domingensis]|nr:hypothetical protein FGB62_50g230 [Gracilaria domingensis]
MRGVRTFRLKGPFAPTKLFLVFTLINVLVFLSVTVLTILFATRRHHAHCTQGTEQGSPTRDGIWQKHVNNNLGPSGIVTILTRLRDAIGTAVQTWGFGPGRKHDIRHTQTSSPLPFVYRDTVSALAGEECEHSDSRCELLTSGFGTVGVVRYTFAADRENIIGSSTQVQTACRCIGDDCDKAILMRPVNISERGKDGHVYFTGKKSCIYHFYEGRFTDCHGESLRMQHRTEINNVPGYFLFEVDASQYNHGIWRAVGHRGWDYSCLKDDFYSLPTVNLSLIMGNISSGIHRYPLSRREGIPSGNESLDCNPPAGVIFFRDEDEQEGEKCGAAFQFANAGASFLGTQMDEVAIGKDKRTYLRELPTLLVFWEIMILISAATLGLYFAISALRGLAVGGAIRVHGRDGGAGGGRAATANCGAWQHSGAHGSGGRVTVHVDAFGDCGAV